MQFLARMMIKGKPFRHAESFKDRRHQEMYNALVHLQGQVHEPSPEQLIQYLAEYHNLDKAGGAGYVKSVFEGCK
jgi:replicative DNA helicase